MWTCAHRKCRNDAVIKEAYVHLLRAQIRFGIELGDNVRTFYPTQKFDGSAVGVFIKTVPIWHLFQENDRVNILSIWN